MTQNNYSLLLKQAEALLSSESDAIANAANLSSLIYHHVDGLNWAGFYFSKDSELVLGPFCGQVACTRIPVGHGVCGSAYSNNETTVVADVNNFEGHIACDAASESEIVVPFKRDGLSGVLDIDSPHKARFGDSERDFFEKIIQLYLASITKCA
ncbi:MAG: L-methionine (R)-S-oxide reductase [Arenicella sp.]|jgi:L-methionine (R)-S-oxide reductase